MPIFSPTETPPGYRTLCGLTHDPSGKRYDFVTGDRHEQKCQECIGIQKEINVMTNALVEINRLGHVIKSSKVTKKVRDHFNLSANRARQEIGHARARKLREWGGI